MVLLYREFRNQKFYAEAHKKFRLGHQALPREYILCAYQEMKRLSFLTIVSVRELWYVDLIIICHNR